MLKLASFVPSLDAPCQIIKIPFVRITLHLSAVPVQHFEETINGCEYVIEVSPVDSNLWRAYLVRLPGGSTALMPFYGPTPDEAARQLSNWLRLAHRTSSKAV